MFPRKLFLHALIFGLVTSWLLTATSCSGRKTRITEQEVKAFLEKMDQAARNRDVDEVMAGIAENAQFKLRIKGPGSVPEVNWPMDREQYERHLRQTLSVVEKYEYKRGMTIINVDQDGQSALVADEVFERVTMKGQVIGTRATGSATLKLENGKLVIEKAEIAGRPLNKAENPFGDEL